MTPAPLKPVAAPDVLEKIDIRVGTIASVEDIAGAKRLLALRVDFGDHVRIIVAGLRQERTNAQEITGRQALFVVNLAPRKIHGVVSEGMLFDVGYQDGLTPVLA
ncbi:MAG: hypothetical protein ACRD2R_09755, partial [Terriglobales bacterium]